MSFTLYKLAAKNLHLATIFLQLVAKNLRIFFNVPPCRHYQVTPSLTVVQDIEVLGPSSVFCNGGGGGIIASSEGTSLVGGCGGILPQKIFKFGGSEMLLSALVMRYGSKKSTLNMKMADDCKSLYNQNN